MRAFVLHVRSGQADANEVQRPLMIMEVALDGVLVSFYVPSALTSGTRHHERLDDFCYASFAMRGLQWRLLRFSPQVSVFSIFYFAQLSYLPQASSNISHVLMHAEANGFMLNHSNKVSFHSVAESCEFSWSWTARK